MLGKILIFTFCFLGIFALVLGAMPMEFLAMSFNPTYRDVEVRQTFEANSMIVYDNMGNDNMTFQYSSLNDAPSPPQWSAGLPTNQYLEIKWEYTTIPGVTVFKAVMALQKQKNWFGPIWWYSEVDRLKFYTVDGEQLGIFLLKNMVEDNYVLATNSSRFTAKGNQIATNIILKPANGSDIGASWDAGNLQYYLTYNVNFTMSGVSAFNIVGSLLTFQAPDLGIPAPWGGFMNLLIAIPMWCAIAYIIYKVLAGLIPFISGGSGD